MRAIGWKIIPIILFLLLSVFLWRGLSLDPHELPSVQIGTALPDFNLPQLHDQALFFSAKQLPHRVILLNVWASWCAACTEEQAFMLHLARKGVLIYGLNYKDEASDALQWLTQWGNPYQVIAYDHDGKVAIDLGVYGAPETFIIDKQGIIRYRHAGIMTEELWVREISPLIHHLEQAS